MSLIEILLVYSFQRFVQDYAIFSVITNHDRLTIQTFLDKFRTEKSSRDFAS